MSELPPPEAFESVLDAELPQVARDRRRDLRRTLYAMALEELDAGRMTKRRREELIRYGMKLGLDAIDVRLLMTGAEYRSGYCPRSGLLPRVEAAETQFLAPVHVPSVATASLIMAGCAWGVVCGVLWWLVSR